MTALTGARTRHVDGRADRAIARRIDDFRRHPDDAFDRWEATVEAEQDRDR